MQIETERLILRPLEIADLDALLALQAEPKMARFIGTFSRAELAEWVQGNIEEWAEHGRGRMAILERDRRKLVGRTGVRLLPRFDELELAWALAAEVRGRGYATEAAAACLDWALREHRPEYVTSMIDPGNAPSIAVAERLGMRPLREDVYEGEELIVYAASAAPRGR